MEFLLYSKVDGVFFDNFEIEITDKDNNKLVYDHLKKNFKKDANDDDNKNKDNISNINVDKKDKNSTEDKNTKTSSSKCFFIKQDFLGNYILIIFILNIKHILFDKYLFIINFKLNTFKLIIFIIFLSV